MQINNDLIFHQVWDLNKKQADEILQEILTTDRIIHEQQLGNKWTPPDQNVVEKYELPSFKSALEVIAELCHKGKCLGNFYFIFNNF